MVTIAAVPVLRLAQDRFAPSVVSGSEGFAYSGVTPYRVGKEATMNHLRNAHEYNSLMDAAKARAHELRDEALQELWNETGDATRRMVRAANRLAHSLARHMRLRERHHSAQTPVAAHSARLPLV